MLSTPTLQLSLSDIARLAHVQRPVVSMWRNRPLPGQPFPGPAAVVAGQERFDAKDVAEYLDRTGRGRNPEAKADVAVHALFAARSSLDDAIAFDGLTALLCVAAMIGDSVGNLSAAELQACAAHLDPNDVLLRREVAALGEDAEALAVQADELADAAYSVKSAFEMLLRQRLHHGLAGHGAVALHPDATALVAEVAVALASDAEWAAPLFVDTADGSGDLLLSIVDAYGATRPSVATLARDSFPARLARRRLRIHDVHRVDVEPNPDSGDAAIPAGFDGAIHVLQFPTPERRAMSDSDILAAVGDMEVQLDADARAVVLAPASALVDRLRTAEADKARDAILRGGRVRGAIRLPKGLIVRSPRRAVALWVLGPVRGDVPIAERVTAVGDVISGPITEAVVADVVADVVTAMAGRPMTSHRAFRFARLARTSTLLIGRRSLVHPSAEEQDGAELRVLADLVADRHCRVLSGSRIDPADLIADGRRVVGSAELLGDREPGTRCVDPVTFADAYPGAYYTEPGDVVFCTSPRVAAWVDREGGCVVLSPARIVRVVDDPYDGRAPLVPEVIATDIDAVSGDAKDWRRWPIRLVPREHLVGLEGELRDIRRRRDELVAQLADLDRETATLIATRTRKTTTHQEER